MGGQCVERQRTESGNHNQPLADAYRSILTGKSIPFFFRERVKGRPDDVAFRYKKYGIYNNVTWSEYWTEVEAFALGLLTLGLETKDLVAIMGDPCPEWFYADLAILCSGAISFGIYSTSSPEETRYAVEQTKATFFLAENQEYVDKILPFADSVPSVRKIVVFDTRATFMYDDPRLIGFSDVQEMGRARKKENSATLQNLIDKVQGEDPAFLVFTSGTSGPAKAAVISHRNILSSLVYATSETLPNLTGSKQRVVSHLSLAHIVERAYSIYFPLIYDWAPHVGEKVDYIQETIYEVRPTCFTGVPRIWEKFAAKIIVGIESSSRLKRFVYRLSMNIAESYMKVKWDSPRVPLRLRALYWCAKQICFRHILHQVGLNRVKYATSTGAPLPPRIQEIWQMWGVDLINQYGSTETSGLISSQSPGFPRPGDLGKPTSVNAVKLEEDGELMFSGPGVFLGYLNDRKMTQEVVKEGWLCMGEIFEYTEAGNLKMIDRKKDIMVTSGGKTISPSYIENAIMGSPYISQAVLFADGRKFPSALVEINFDTVSDWARRNKVMYTSYTSLTMHPEVVKLISEEVAKGNQNLARVEQVKKFAIIPQELDPETGDTTPTRKIKRNHMYKMFKDLVEEMYPSE